MAKKLTTTKDKPTLRLRSNKTAAAKSAVAKKAAITKKLKKESEVILNDEKIKDLLDAIATMTVDLDKLSNQCVLLNQELSLSSLVNSDLRKEVESLRREKLHWESTCNDFQLELATQKATVDNVTQMANNAIKELEEIKSIHNDSISNNYNLRQLLEKQELEMQLKSLENIKYQTMYEMEKSEKELGQKVLSEIDNKWYNKLLKMKKN